MLKHFWKQDKIKSILKNREYENWNFVKTKHFISYIYNQDMDILWIEIQKKVLKLLKVFETIANSHI